MNKISFMIIVFFAFGVLKAQQAGQQEVKFPEVQAIASKKLSYIVIPSPGNTFGYDIYSDSQLMIHQPSVPGLPGNAGFNSRESAGKIARLVIDKMKHGAMPPSVSEKEMRDLKAIP